ncbi:F-box/RNI-like superfamily protein [Prunus dulcis]|uniref:F-box/RNI-like superfamily protein n=1 Tax=Prunus dulcis TaxID=3755 RepID=A0A5H2XZR9_PRUDU|nr:F-box/RNI-like superfamily protein [Prunus dulcis]
MRHAWKIGSVDCQMKFFATYFLSFTQRKLQRPAFYHTDGKMCWLLFLALTSVFSHQIWSQIVARGSWIEYLPLVAPHTFIDCGSNLQFRSLKTICIRGFCGRPYEMEVAKYLLKHGEQANRVKQGNKTTIGFHQPRTISDRISGLPDEVLCHILSFLYTITAVKTCVLSHRWKNLWASVPNLKLLICSPKSDSTCSPGFVDRVLSSRGSSRIHRFHLNLYGAHKYFLMLMSGFALPLRRYELPRTLFMCKTLVILKLRLQFDIVAIPPNSDCFPNLKFLHVSVCFPDADSMKKLFSCCPALEDLIIDGNVEKIPGDADLVLRLNNAKALSKAKVDVQVYRRYHADPGIDYARRTHRLFAGIINVKSLSLAAPILTNIKCHADHDKNDQWCQPETLPICLFSKLKTVCVRGFRWHSDEMEAVKYMLKHGEALNKVTVYARNISAEKQMEWQQEFVDFPRHAL